MLEYKTIEEKVAQWGGSVSYIRMLCRQGKIEGATKRAGVWFIPDSAENPAKQVKTTGRYLMFTSTKKKIFESAIELFAFRSYDIVSIKDIADEVGVRQSAVYNHFSSKQEILDTIYDFYCHYYTADRPTLEELEPILKNGSLLDIINCSIYQFDDEYRELMLNITRIVLQRKFIDPHAMEISKRLITEEGIRYCKEIFDTAVQMGRLAPFDTYMLSMFCNSNRIFVLWGWVLEPTVETAVKLLDYEQTLNKFAIQHLTDLSPPT